MIKLNLGCGQIRPQGWINTDSSINSFIQKLPLGKQVVKALGAKQYDSTNMSYMNLNKKWSRFKSNSIAAVYASHLFEHLSLKSRDVFLKEAFRTMESGAVIRLVVPDMELHAIEYIEALKKGDQKATGQFMWVLNLHREGQYPNNQRFHNWLGYLQEYPHQHKFMYDRYSFSRLLKEYGFKDIKISEFGKSNYLKEITDVEFDINKSYGNSLYIEAIK